MVRLFLTLGVVLLLVLGLAAAAGVLAYGTEAPRDGELDVPGLGQPVTLAWDDAGTVWVEAGTEAALAAGLGYAHAVDHGWAASLWRQAALGRLAEWFGPDLRALDLHARTLGFDGLARRSYEVLPNDDRAALDAYALGASAGFAEPGAAQSNAFIVADVVPTGWEPWDALAVERLHAYLAAPSLAADSTWQRGAAQDSTVAAFVRSDSLFRAFLGFPGGGHDRVYALDGGTARTLVQHTSAGTSALDFLAPAILKTGGRTTLALTIPGTLVSPSGWTGGTGWGMLLSSDVRLEPYAGAAPPPVFSRIVDRDGDETLLSVARDTSGLVLRPGRETASADTAAVDTTSAATTPPVGTASRSATPAPASPNATASGAPADSAQAATGWRVRWRGFALGSDVGAFRALRAGRVPAGFAILDGDGLVATSDRTRLLGSPLLASTGAGVAFVAGDSLARYAAQALRESPADSAAADSTFQLLDSGDRDLTSGWARDLLPGMMAGLGRRDSLPDVLQGPYAYLKSWDGAYRPDGIAPSLFEWWLVSHRELTGDLPDLTDTLSVALLPSSLRIARAELRDRYGALPTEWRWGRLQGGPTYAVLGGRGSAAARRFREPLPPAGGHPTAPVPGPSIVFEDDVPGVAIWSVRTRLGDGRTEIRYPGNRPPPSGVLEIDPQASSQVWAVTPSAPLPESRLVLRPAR